MRRDQFQTELGTQPWVWELPLSNTHLDESWLYIRECLCINGAPVIILKCVCKVYLISFQGGPVILITGSIFFVLSLCWRSFPWFTVQNKSLVILYLASNFIHFMKQDILTLFLFKPNLPLSQFYSDCWPLENRWFKPQVNYAYS